MPHGKSDKPWNPNKYSCKECGDIISSPRPGAYVSCKCQNISVDQTRQYERVMYDKSAPVLWEKGDYENS
jgi:hypothetical protein